MSDSVTETEVRAEAVTPRDAATEPVSGPPVSGPATAAPLGVPRTPTGDADVDAALERLGDADHLATDGHLQVYEDVHGGLRAALTALDTRPEAPGPTGAPATTGPRKAPEPAPPYHRHRS
jgi:hypothetical protein